MELNLSYGIRVLLLLFPLVSSFNLEPRAAIVFAKPKSPSDSEERQSYFGFSVALLKSNADDKAWLMVGAPRANSSMYNASIIPEPGAFYKCDVSNKECKEVVIDPDGNAPYISKYPFEYHDKKNYGWLGSALDSQPDERQATVVCAGRLKNQQLQDRSSICGKCYWLNSSLSDSTAHEINPLTSEDPKMQSYYDTDQEPSKWVPYYSQGQAGMAVHFPKHVNNTEMLIGAPGVLNWQGTVIRNKDREINNYDPSNRRKREINPNNEIIEKSMFVHELIPPPQSTSHIDDDDLFGYAVSSGRLHKNSVYYVGGSPRGANSRGKVLIFEFPYNGGEPIKVNDSFSGVQIGEYFGGSVAMLDANGDDVDELVVGAPLHALSNKPDVGKLYYYENQNGKLVNSTTTFVGSGTAYSRFATTLAVLGDLNNDGYEDLAVGAPWENDHVGAVYIYLGSNTGLQSEYSQRLSPDQFEGGNHLGFGMALSRGVDVDGNHYPDLGVGSFLSGHAVLFRSRPVASITANLTAKPEKIILNATSLNLEACVGFEAKYSNKNININITLSLDHSFSSPRALFSNGASKKYISIIVVKSQQKCKDFDIEISKEKMDPNVPLHMKMEYTLIENYNSSEELISELIIDTRESAKKNLMVGIVTGCEKDGNNTCSTDLHVDAYFNVDGMFNNFTIGSKRLIPLSVNVTNEGEPAFLPKLIVSVEDPLKLYLPRTHDCKMPEKYDRRKLICMLNNPLDKKDELTVNVDVSDLKDQKTDVTVNVTVNSEGIELNPADNSKKIKLELNGKASLQIIGYSWEEQLVYHIDKNGIINTTSDMEVEHNILIRKMGPSPISKAELKIDLPTNITENELDTNFLQMTVARAEFGDQQVICSIVDAVPANFNKHITGPRHDSVLTYKRNNSESERKRSRRSAKRHSRAVDSDSKGVSQSEEPAKLHLSCDNSGIISCAKVSCPIGSPWTSNSDSVSIILRIKLSLSTIAKNMPSLNGAVLITRVKAFIGKNKLNIGGNKVAEKMIKTPIIPKVKSLGIPWWYILLAILAGVLLLGIMTYALYKSGFFKRAKKDEMMAQKATVQPNDTSNLVEND